MSISKLTVGGKEKSVTSISICFSLLHAASRIGTEIVSVLSHCVNERGHGDVMRGNVS